MTILTDSLIPEIAYQKPIISMNDNNKYFIMNHTYYTYLVKLPHFSVLSAAEQAEVRRIFHEVPTDVIMAHATYHYENHRQKENGFSYIAENIKHILSLPETDKDSIIAKFLMIATLGKMKFLSKRNIDLIFAERRNIVRFLQANKAAGKNSTLTELFESLLPVLKETHTANMTEMDFYIKMTLSRWFSEDSLTLHEVIMKQEIFAHELDPVSHKTHHRLDFTLRNLVKDFLLVVKDSGNEATPWKGLFEESKSFSRFKGYINSTIKDVYVHRSLFENNYSPLNRDSSDRYLSFLDLKNHFPVEWVDVSQYIECISQVSSRRVSSDLDKAIFEAPYFLYCLLRGDNEKFVQLKKVLDNSSFQQLAFNRYVDFLEMVKAYSEESSNTPLSLIFQLYDFEYSESLNV